MHPTRCDFPALRAAFSLLSPGLLHVLAAAWRTRRRKPKACIISVSTRRGSTSASRMTRSRNAPERDSRPVQTVRATPVPGIHFTEGLPLISRHADKLCILRRRQSHTIRCHKPGDLLQPGGAARATDPMAISNPHRREAHRPPALRFGLREAAAPQRRDAEPRDHPET